MRGGRGRMGGQLGCDEPRAAVMPWLPRNGDCEEGAEAMSRGGAMGRERGAEGLAESQCRGLGS